MSLKAKFKTESALVRDGTWFDVTANSDGSKCRVKLRRTGRGNPLWSVAYREHTKDQDMENLAPEQDEIITAKIFAEGAVADWENFQPNDDGHNVPFSTQAAMDILVDPDWVELLKDWQIKAQSLAPFQAKREDEAKN
jgi:hypothetical protein